jgi:hypothetical protein
MSDVEIADYLRFGDAYFGNPQKRSKKKLETPYELFEWFVETQSSLPREKILEWFSQSPYFEDVKALNGHDLLLEYCERMIAVMDAKKNEKKQPAT